MGEEVPEVGVIGRSKSVSILALVGADVVQGRFCLTRMGVIRRVAPIEGAIWIIVLVIPHLARFPITRL